MPATPPSAPGALPALYFDGQVAAGRPVRLMLQADQLVAQLDEGSALRWPLAAVQWPERTRHGQRTLHLAEGGLIQCADANAFDAWRQAAGGATAHESWVVRAQQNWRLTLGALALLVALGFAGYRYGVPLLAEGVVAALPASADAAVGEAALAQIEQRWLKPSTLPPARQAELRAAFTTMLQQADAGSVTPVWRLEFRAAGESLGPNAFALPGGVIVLTDALVALLAGADDALLGVLAHEMGHVRLRHGMRSVVQVTLISAVTSVALGDFSAVLAGAPVLLAQTAYSRAFEREADAEAARMLAASGRDPAVMVEFFERLQASAGGKGRDAPPIAIASHPADAERIAFFRDAGRRR